MTSIQLNNVSVHIPIYNATSRSLKNRLLQVGSGGKLDIASGRVVVQALKDISFTLEHGDRVGLIGANGAGKTTLLRVLAGVYEPTIGTVRINGSIAALFDISLGVDVEATGRENILMRGIYLGLSKQEIKKRYDEIAEFTELGDYLNMPVRTYSAGMMMRIGFAVSTHVKPDILLMDEWIAAGDAHFIDKAEKRLTELVNRAGIMVLASHSEQLIERVCNKAALMHHGQLLQFGSVPEILSAYRNVA